MTAPLPYFGVLGICGLGTRPCQKYNSLENVYEISTLKVCVTITKSLECLIIEFLKVIAVPMAAVITEDAWVLVCELFVKVGCVLKQDELSSAAS